MPHSTAAAVPIDLRSDTVTRPSPAMRAAMSGAEVGDDQFGEDPTVNLLQDRVAALLGKERALWLPSGTMANQVTLRTLTSPGDDVIVSRESHLVLHETGGAAANSGVQLTEVGDGGVFTAQQMLLALKPRDHIIYPPTTLVAVENTHNRAGGVIFPQTDAAGICEDARAMGVPSYLDGARLWNAAVASGQTPGQLAEPFDLVSVALSKGLGAPAGSLLAGTEEVIRRAARFRRMFGGAMRQVGILAAGGAYAIEHNYDRLAEDHANAQLLAARLAECEHIDVNPAAVRTNILMMHLREHAPDAATVIEGMRQRGVLAFAFGPRTIRLVTHMDVSAAQCTDAGDILVEVVMSGVS
ncbi:MAG TPA: GntG family PLP-dependent aldolase [Gemmatimonadaceae bacterium]|nr:GntG family PLP-dependent aldolase [Gemmatimonadaceae bacterium]